MTSKIDTERYVQTEKKTKSKTKIIIEKLLKEIKHFLQREKTKIILYSLETM